MNVNLYPPKKLRLNKDTFELEITWQNDDTHRISGEDLRRYCACSSCRSRQLIGVHLLTDCSEMAEVNLIANEAVQIVFADGHNRGIFPWPYLNAIAVGRVKDFVNV
ncbi:MAG: DUF971 family protein [Paraglaciecola sp.]